MEEHKTLIIEIPYGGLGDHFFHSHLPRIAKETGVYERVIISERSIFRHPDNRHLVWKLNPFVDGFVDEPGESCNLKILVERLDKANDSGKNLLDEVMFAFNLDDGLRHHEPECYYKPLYKEEFNKVIFDPNFLSWVGEIDKRDMMHFLKREKYNFEAIMKLRTDKALYIPKNKDLFIETPTITDFCDLIFSSKRLYCLTSGTATLASALGKGATVFYGKNQGRAFQHSKLHNYTCVPGRPLKRIRNKFHNS
ncbi:MAG: hypothetical protein CVU09_15210 [Bacteroidetes bacterium HGW-Bacteroidetes-4]|jgi:hypothetical protein|nr:MAG: hypothetical protein CVU09_15210 [Bacteroidetes bacterium HGW-Bacteroidetes-4]